MMRRQRIRRVTILCVHCLRNLAFHKAWQESGKPFKGEQFWITTNNNFLDIAVLEWCKLFADPRGKHYWEKVVSDTGAFSDGLLQTLKITSAMLDDYIAETRTYRDKFVAHLDDEERMYIPNLTLAIKSSIYLYDYLFELEDDEDALYDAPRNARAFYRAFLAEGKTIYSD